MDDVYQRNRRMLLERGPMFAPLAPEQPPTAAAAPATSAAQRYAALRAAANHHGQLVLIVGWGDGSLPYAVAEDPVLRAKDVYLLVLAGEEPAFARSLADPRFPSVFTANTVLTYVPDDATLELMIGLRFGLHQHIPPIAGIEIVDTHPLAPAASAVRDRQRPLLEKLLVDRPQTYGNDIIDSFTGLHQASWNAPRLLRAPTLEQLTGLFGQTPVISIAAGPSLRRHIPRLRELQDRCILVCCDAVLHGLLDAGIEPHFCTPLERVPMIEPMLTRADQCRTIFAGIGVVMPTVVERFGDRLTCIWGMDDLYRWLDPGHTEEVMTGSSTGVLSVSVAMALGTGPVYLVGHDLAKDAASTHWDGAGYAAGDWKRVKELENPDQGVGTVIGYEDRLIPGNDGGLVRSIAWWDRFRAEIALLALHLSNRGRTMFNVNAHDRVGAQILHTRAAPLPDPASLPRIPWPTLPAGDPGRFAAWSARARAIDRDVDAFLGHVTALRHDIEAAKPLPPRHWNLPALAARLSTNAAVSEGNRLAFSYFLRSALFNTNADYHHRRRQTMSAARRDWDGLRTMQGLCVALGNAVTTLRPRLDQIAQEFARAG